GKSQLYCTEFARFGHHAEPGFGVEFVFNLGYFNGVGAIGALQWAAVGEFCEKPKGWGGNHVFRPLRRSSICSQDRHKPIHGGSLTDVVSVRVLGANTEASSLSANVRYSVMYQPTL